MERPKTRWVAADVATDPLEGHFRGADAVVHLAWLIQPSRDERALEAVNVHGSRRVFEAAARAGARALVHASSVGAYSAGPDDRAVDERWPTGGTPTAFYARHKAAAERALDEVEAAHPELRVVRLRPGLIFKRDAASGIRRLFAGPLLPSPLVDPELLPVLPAAARAAPAGRARRRRGGGLPARLHGRQRRRRLQRRRRARARRGDARPAARRPRGRGARPRRSARPPGSRWRLRLQPTPPGWLDMGLAVPVMDCSRIRDELGWAPRHTAGEALLELLRGMRDSAGASTPPLHPHAGGRFRSREFATASAGPAAVVDGRQRRRGRRAGRRLPASAHLGHARLDQQRPDLVLALDLDAELLGLGDLARRRRRRP